MWDLNKEQFNKLKDSNKQEIASLKSSNKKEVEKIIEKLDNLNPIASSDSSLSPASIELSILNNHFSELKELNKSGVEKLETLNEITSELKPEITKIVDSSIEKIKTSFENLKKLNTEILDELVKLNDKTVETLKDSVGKEITLLKESNKEKIIELKDSNKKEFDELEGSNKKEINKLQDVLKDTIVSFKENNDKKLEKVNNSIIDFNNENTLINNSNTSLLISQGESNKEYLNAIRICGCTDYPEILSEEYYNGKDLDNNNMVYGKDFIITNPPLVLKDLNESNQYDSNPTELTEDQYITQVEKKYLEYFDYEDKREFIKLPYPNNLIQEYYLNKDKDGNKLVYGRDFIIEEDNVPFILKNINKNILKENPSITKYSKFQYENIS